MRALASLAVRDGLTVNELAVDSLAEQPTMSRTLDQLERDGFITRTVSETDSRVRHCSLTDAGREMYQLTWPEMDAAEQAMFEGVSDEDRAHLLATLGRMLGNIKQNDF
jgi:DNA-binding MarR family transcriptional regulator